MKKSIVGVIALVALLLFAFKPGEEEKYPTLNLGSIMPLADHVMMNVDGKELSLNKVSKENGTLVIFSCNTCPFVIQWEDRYDDVSGIANRLKIGTVFINSNEAKRAGDDSYDMMQAHAEANFYKAPYVLDKNSEVANAFGAKTTPHVFLFDAQGKLVYKGSIDDNSKDITAVKEHYLKDALYALGNGKEIVKNQTDAKGCSIKRLAE
jgi:thioredoxin-related protein